MKEVKVTMYEANDGKLFDTKEHCLVYESKEILKAVSNVCKEQESCQNCLFYGICGCTLCGMPEDWFSNDDEDF